MIYTNSKIKQSNGPGVECQIPFTSGEGRSYQRGSDRPLARSRRAAASWASKGPGPSPAPQPESRADAHDRVRVQGHHRLCGPLCVVRRGRGKEKSQAHHSEGPGADRRQSALQWAGLPAFPAFLPSYPCFPETFPFWGWGGAAINTARCE